MNRQIAIALFFLAWFFPAKAAFLIAGSRVIFDAREGEVSVLIRQIGSAPSLMQVWLDDEGTAEAMPETTGVPFILTPAVARLEPGRGQSVRILKVGGDLPEDRESFFWLNVLEVPPKPSGDEESRLQFSFQARVKFFYRPRGLRGNPERAHQSLRFSLDSAQAADGGVQLRVRNPSPYHITFKSLALNSAAGASVLAEMNEAVLARMVAPGGELVIPLERVAAAGRQALSGARIHYGVINDYGATIEGQSVLN